MKKKTAGHFITLFNSIIEPEIWHKFLKTVKSKAVYGFFNGKSTQDALASLTSNIPKSLDDNEKVLGVFLDIEKAFYTVHQVKLLSTLHNIGIEGNAHTAFKSYLNKRLQKVKVNNCSSNPSTVVEWYTGGRAGLTFNFCT